MWGGPGVCSVSGSLGKPREGPHTNGFWDPPFEFSRNSLGPWPGGAGGCPVCLLWGAVGFLPAHGPPLHVNESCLTTSLSCGVSCDLLPELSRPHFTSLPWGSCLLMGHVPSCDAAAEPSVLAVGSCRMPHPDVPPVAVEAVASGWQAPLHPSGIHRGSGFPGRPALPPAPHPPPASLGARGRLS